MVYKREINKIWETEIEILDFFDKVCRKNGLRYSLAYGTLLGAIRHKGFIPWDDDIDVIMPRKDYEKLLEIWKIQSSDKYLIQSYKTDLDYTNNFAKIRKNHTTFLQNEYEKNKKYHKGIFIDVFPIDRVASNKLSQTIQYMACAINLLYTKDYTSGKKGFMHLIEKSFLLLNKQKKRKILFKAEKIIKYWNKKSNNDMFSCCTIECCRKYYPADLFEQLQLRDFNGKKYYTVKDFDTVLKTDYGDYMKLPPNEEQKWKHHPLLISFDKNYEEIGDSYEK